MRTFLKDILKTFVVTVFFVSTLFLSLYAERVFVSPDESAAFFFAKQFANIGSLSVHETLNTDVHGIIHPRSIAVMGEYLVPGSFLGMPITAGILMMGFGDAGALLLTPVLALIGVLALRAVVRALFEDDGLADLSALLFMAHPAYLYFSGRVMMHNVAFVDFLIFAAFFAVVRPFGLKSVYVRELRRLEYIISGIMVGAALFFRLSEALWVLPIAFGLLIAFRNNLGWRNILAFFFGLGIMGMVIGYTNSWVYGSLFTTGYSVQSGIDAAPVAVANAPQTNLATSPFGFHPRAVLRNVWDYGFVLYPWMTVTSLLGFGLLAFRRFEKNKTWKTVTVVAILVSTALLAFYGSWNFIDNPDPSLVTIGNSHVRYWIPVFALSIPFAAYFLLSLWRALGGSPSFQEGARGSRALRALARACLALAVIVALYANVHLVFSGHDGILASRRAMDSFIGKRAQILSATEPESVIVVDRADKYLFPYRRVIVPLRSEQTYSTLPELVKDVPTYYFGITFPQTDLDYLNGEKLKALGLKIELIFTIHEESLYKFSHAQVAPR